ncbi:MAG: hypothetical protein WBX77_15620 [Pseudolabrys sp.]
MRGSVSLLFALIEGEPSEARITPRLSLDTTVHEERFAEGDLGAKIDAYDRRRAAKRTAISARPSVSAATNFTAGLRTKRGNTQCRCGLISAPSFGRKVSVWTERPALFFSDAEGQHAVGL